MLGPPVPVPYVSIQGILISTGALDNLLPTKVKWYKLRAWCWPGAATVTAMSVAPEEPAFQFNSRAYDDDDGVENSAPPPPVAESAVVSAPPISSTPVDGPPVTEEDRPPSGAVMQRLPTVRKLGEISDSDERVFSTWGRLSD